MAHNGDNGQSLLLIAEFAYLQVSGLWIKLLDHRWIQKKTGQWSLSGRMLWKLKWIYNECLLLLTGPDNFLFKMVLDFHFIWTNIIDNTKLNSTNRDCDLIFSGSITLTRLAIWDFLFTKLCQLITPISYSL